MSYWKFVCVAVAGACAFAPVSSAQPAGGGPVTPILRARPAPAPEAARPDEEAGRKVQVVEASGQGDSELQARKAAVQAAIEQAVGMYIDSQRSSAISLSGDKLTQVVNERVQTFSSAFVDQVETVSSQRGPDGSYSVTVRAHVMVPELVEAMRGANIPVTSVDAVSNQTRLSTQAQMLGDAAVVMRTALKEIPEYYRAEIVPNSVTIILDPLDQTKAALRGTIRLTFDAAEALKLRQAAQSFRSVISDAPLGAFPADAGLPATPNGPLAIASICAGNPLGQTSCHGESVDAAKAFGSYKGTEINVELRAGRETLGKASARLSTLCVNPASSGVGGSNSAVADFLEAPLASPFSQVGQFWTYVRQMALGHRAPTGASNGPWATWGYMLRTVPAALFVTAVEATADDTAAPSSPSSASLNRQGSKPWRPGVVCMGLVEQDRKQMFAVVVPQRLTPVDRFFYIVGPRSILEQVDGLRAFTETATKPD